MSTLGWIIHWTPPILYLIFHYYPRRLRRWCALAPDIPRKWKTRFKRCVKWGYYAFVFKKGNWETLCEWTSASYAEERALLFCPAVVEWLLGRSSVHVGAFTRRWTATQNHSIPPCVVCLLGGPTSVSQCCQAWKRAGMWFLLKALLSFVEAPAT